MPPSFKEYVVSDQFITRTITDVDGNDHEMLEVQYTTRGPARGRRWYTCHICALDFPEDQVILSGGVAYCLPYKCYEDLEGER